MGFIPLGDASRRPVRMPAVTVLIILLNAVVFALELAGGQTFVMQWSVIPAQIASGQHLITILTGMFMHGGWSHIIGNMIYLWAFGPEVEDAMGRWRYLGFYLAGGLAATLAQVAGNPHSTIPNLGASGAIAAVMGAFLVTYPRDRIRTALFIFRLCASSIYSGCTPHRGVVRGPALQCRRRGAGADGWGGVPGAHRRFCVGSGRDARVRRFTSGRRAMGPGMIP